jgi:sec-independent protein translocase protein TatA
MGFGSWWHWVIVLAVILLLFGRGRISETMGDFGKGIRSFKKGLNDEDKPAPPPPAQQIPPPPAETAAPTPAPAPNPTSTEN